MTQIHVLGAGAIGCLFAGALKSHHHAVCLIVRNGLVAEGCDPQSITIDGQAIKIDAFSPQALAPSSIDCLLVCTKAQDGENAVTSIRSALKPSTQIILLQNGMGQHERFQQLFPQSSIYAGLSTEGVTKVGPRQIQRAGYGSTVFGQMYGPTRALPAGLSACGLSISLTDNIRPTLWRKLAINAAINGLTALHRCPNGELIQRPDVYENMMAICDEVERILVAENVSINVDVGSLAKSICLSTAQNLSSMLQDTLAGRCTEIDYIYGYLLKRASYHNIVLPNIDKLFQQLTNL